MQAHAARMPTPEQAAAQAALDAMARNRASSRRPPMRDGAGLDAHPLARVAFIDTTLALDVAAARMALKDARQAPCNVGTKADRLAARKGIQQAAAALSAAEGAVAAEDRGELAAPLVQRQDHVMDGVLLREARVVEVAGKRMALVHPLDRMLARRSIDAAQCAAGHRYRHAWEMAGRDAYPIGLSGGEASGRTAPGSGNWRIEAAVGCGVDLAQMRAALGTAGVGLVEHVAVHELDLAGWASRQKLNPQVVTGMFSFALTLLAEWTVKRGSRE